MTPHEIEDLRRRAEALEQEVARLRAQVAGTADARTTPARPDVLFSALEKTRMPMIVTDPQQPDDPIIFVNRAFQDLCGYDADALLGRNCRFLQGPGTDPVQVDVVRRAMAENRDVAVEILNYRRDGTAFVNELYVSPVFDDEGRLLYRFGSQVDVTGYRRDKMRLQANEGRLRAILESAVDFAIIAADRDGLITEWNSGAERIFGWSAAEMHGETAERFFVPEDRANDRVETEMRLALAEGRAGDERWHLRKDGSRFFASGEMMPLRDDEGTHLGFLKILSDRTQARQQRQRAFETERALAASEERLRLAAEATGIGIFDFQPETGALEWDDRLRALFGVGPDAAVTYEGTFLSGVHPDDRAMADAAVQAALDPGGDGLFDVAYRIRPTSGDEERWLAARGRTVFEDGRAVRFVGTVRDVTAQATAERAVAATQERYRLVTRATNDAIWDWDLARDHVAWSEALSTAYGYDLATVEPTGAWWIDKIHPEDRARVHGDIRASIAGSGTEWSHEYRFRRADGSYADVLDRGFMVRGPRGEPVRMIGAMLDLTERKRAERAVTDGLASLVAARTSERDRLWETTNDLMGAAGFDGYLKEINPAWTRMLGWSEAEVLSRPFLELVDPADHHETATVMKRLAAGETVTGFVDRVLTRDGGSRFVMWTAVPDLGGGIFHVVGRDLTEQRHAEEALHQSQKLEAIGQLTGGVAHDFNNLLTIIRSSVDFLRRRDLPEERRRRYVDAVSDTVDRAAKLTGQLLAFARRQALKPEVFEVGGCLSSVSDMLDSVTGARIRVQTQLPDRPCHVRADLGQFETALINMAVNARDAMDGEGTLTLGLAADRPMPPIRGHGGSPGPFVAVSLVDTGAGIPADALSRIFEPFFTTKEVGKGTGLGLSQVFGFAKQSGGDVDVASAPGRGTTFTLYLPQVQAGIEEEGEAEEMEGPSPRGAGRRVLVVEDNVEVGRFATQTLEDLGYVTVWAANANEALQRLADEPRAFDVVFSDVVMPGMNGVELGHEIRRRHPGLPVVLASGYSHVLAEEGRHGFELLHKPYSVEQLSRVLRGVSRPRRTGQARRAL